MAINYQNTYEVLLAQQAELQNKCKAQSGLMEEASAAIHTAETETQQCHQELLHLKQEHQKEVDFVVSRMAKQYKAQLTSAQGSLENRISSISWRSRNCRKNPHSGGVSC